MIIESLENKLHTFCVKSIASNLNEFKKIIDVKNKHKDLISARLNNQWNEASLKMQELLNDKNEFGDLKMGNCIMWGDKILKVTNL